MGRPRHRRRLPPPLHRAPPHAAHAGLHRRPRRQRRLRPILPHGRLPPAPRRPPRLPRPRRPRRPRPPQPHRPGLRVRFRVRARRLGPRHRRPLGPAPLAPAPAGALLERRGPPLLPPRPRPRPRPRPLPRRLRRPRRRRDVRARVLVPARRVGRGGGHRRPPHRRAGRPHRRDDGRRSRRGRGLLRAGRRDRGGPLPPGQAEPDRRPPARQALPRAHRAEGHGGRRAGVRRGGPAVHAQDLGHGQCGAVGGDQGRRALHAAPRSGLLCLLCRRVCGRRGCPLPVHRSWALHLRSPVSAEYQGLEQPLQRHLSLRGILHSSAAKGLDSRGTKRRCLNCLPDFSCLQEGSYGNYGGSSNGNYKQYEILWRTVLFFFR